MRAHHWRVSVAFAFWLLAAAVPLHAQQLIELGEYCGYVDAIKPKENIYGWRSDEEAQGALRRVMDYTGLEPNFQIVAANVPNAAATIRGSERLILYNQTFMEKVRQTVRTDWGATSILAHEIGHHLQGHTLQQGGSRPEIELQADKFSGFVLQKMGATLEQAQLAMNNLASPQGSATHPARSARIAAIANGWVAARNQSRTSPEKTPTDEPAPQPGRGEEDEPEGEPLDPPFPQPQTRGLERGQLIMPCGCWGPTAGGAVPEQGCQSGSATLQMCPGWCQPLGGYPYAVVCN